MEITLARLEKKEKKAPVVGRVLSLLLIPPGNQVIQAMLSMCETEKCTYTKYSDRAKPLISKTE